MGTLGSFDPMGEAIRAAAIEADVAVVKAREKLNRAKQKYSDAVERRRSLAVTLPPEPASGGPVVVTFRKLWGRVDPATANTYSALRTENGRWHVAGGPRAVEFMARRSGAAATSGVLWSDVVEFLFWREGDPRQIARAVASLRQWDVHL